MAAVAHFPLEQLTRAPLRPRGNPQVTGEEGAWCPLVRPELLARRMVSGKFLLTDLGLEKWCARCQDYWPFDTEFWYPSSSDRDGLYCWCKACYREASGRLAGVARC